MYANTINAIVVYRVNHQNSLRVFWPAKRKYFDQQDEIDCLKVNVGGVFNDHHTISHIYPIPVSCINSHLELKLMSWSLLLPAARKGIKTMVHSIPMMAQVMEL